MTRRPYIQPDAFPNNAGIGTVRGSTTNSMGGATRNRMWQKHQFRTSITWSAPRHFPVSNTFTEQSGTPSGPITTNIAAPDPQFCPATLTINGRPVSNPLATTTRFYYATRGEGQLWTPWLIAWNARVGREFRLNERSSFEVVADVFNITNRGAARQFVAALKKAGKTHLHFTYPKEQHGFSQREHRLDAWRKQSAFLNRYLQPQYGRSITSTSEIVLDEK